MVCMEEAKHKIGVLNDILVNDGLSIGEYINGIETIVCDVEQAIREIEREDKWN